MQFVSFSRFLGIWSSSYRLIPLEYEAFARKCDIFTKERFDRRKTLCEFCPDTCLFHIRSPMHSTLRALIQIWVNEYCVWRDERRTMICVGFFFNFIGFKWLFQCESRSNTNTHCGQERSVRIAESHRCFMHTCIEGTVIFFFKLVWTLACWCLNV